MTSYGEIHTVSMCDTILNALFSAASIIVHWSRWKSQWYLLCKIKQTRYGGYNDNCLIEWIDGKSHVILWEILLCVLLIFHSHFTQFGSYKVIKEDLDKEDIFYIVNLWREA